MVPLSSILELLSKDMCFAVLDQKDAYFHVSIHESHRHYLCFYWDEQVYQYTVLLFGLAIDPKVFKFLAMVMGCLRTHGSIIFLYLHDWLLVSSDPEGLCCNIHLVLFTCNSLGFIVNTAKPCLEAS